MGNNTVSGNQFMPERTCLNCYHAVHCEDGELWCVGNDDDNGRVVFPFEQVGCLLHRYLPRVIDASLCKIEYPPDNYGKPVFIYGMEVGFVWRDGGPNYEPKKEQAK